MKKRELLLMLILMESANPLFAQGISHEMPGDQGYLLPNGWTNRPSGRQADVPDPPTMVVVSSAGIHASVLTSGWNDHGVSVLDLRHHQKTRMIKLKTSCLGMALNALDGRLYRRNKILYRGHGLRCRSESGGAPAFNPDGTE